MPGSFSAGSPRRSSCCSPGLPSASPRRATGRRTSRPSFGARQAPPPLRRCSFCSAMRCISRYRASRCWRTPPNQQWRSFLAVDVLQLIGVTFIAVQLLVLVIRSRRAFMVAAFALAAIADRRGAGDVADRLDRDAAAGARRRICHRPPGRSFRSSRGPASCCIGAGAGQLYARWGAAHLGAFANWGMLDPGGCADPRRLQLDATPPPSGADDFSWVPGQILLRTGVCLVILGAGRARQPSDRPAAPRLRRRRAGIAGRLLRPPVHRLRVGLERRALPVLRRGARVPGQPPLPSSRSSYRCCARLAVERAQAPRARGWRGVDRRRRRCRASPGGLI